MKVINKPVMSTKGLRKKSDIIAFIRENYPEMIVNVGLYGTNRRASALSFDQPLKGYFVNGIPLVTYLKSL